MKRTVAEFMPKRDTDGPVPNRAFYEAAQRSVGLTEEPSEQCFFTIRVIMEPGEVEILDGKCVFERRVLAYRHDEAVFKAGVRCNAS